MALPIWGQICTVSEMEPFEITNFDLGHPVIADRSLKIGILIFKSDRILKNELENMKIYIDQQVYFYAENTREILESYDINGMKITRKLAFKNPTQDQFIWNDGVSQK